MLDLDLSKMPWPDDTTQVFRAGGTVSSLAWHPTTPRQWHLYAEGYRDAAEQLYATWQASKGCPDYIIFPMVFLYRHYVELRLKELLQAADSLLELPRDWQCDHNLDYLWNLLRPRLAQISPSEPDRDSQNAGRLIAELSARDKTSFAFRYPVDKSGNSNTRDLDHLDVDNFVRAMRQLAAFLDGASMAISVYLDEQPNWQ